MREVRLALKEVAKAYGDKWHLSLEAAEELAEILEFVHTKTRLLYE